MFRLVFVLACAGLICAEKPFNLNVLNHRVIGGQNASPNTWKWQASLQYDAYDTNDFYHICGGSIVDVFYIMTAAHCILSIDPTKYRVVLGEYDLSREEGSEQVGVVESIIVHPGWTGDLGNGNDIALLKLAKRIYDNGFVAIADLPAQGQKLPHAFVCQITGWGAMDHYGSVPDILQVAEIRVVEHAICSQPQWWGNIALESMVCAGGDGYTSGCQGDSGGPLNCFINGVLRVHGVASYAPSGGCNQVSKPTVFTRVSSFLDWMLEVMGRK